MQNSVEAVSNVDNVINGFKYAGAVAVTTWWLWYAIVMIAKAEVKRTREKTLNQVNKIR